MTILKINLELKKVCNQIEYKKGGLKWTTKD